MIAVPPPLDCLGLCMMVYPLGSNADIIGLSVSVPVSQVSVNANMSSCWSMMKSCRVVVLLQTDHGLSVHMHSLLACIMLESIMAHCLRFVAFDPIASPTQIKSGLCPTIGTIFCCRLAPPRQPRFVGRRIATPALTAALQAAWVR